MKSLAVGVLMGQTIDTACASELSLPYMKVMTSMAIRDDVVSGESYYVRELYASFYFESHIADNNVTFDYKIHPGQGGESNALALLKAFGFPNEIVQDANCLLRGAQGRSHGKPLHDAEI